MKREGGGGDGEGCAGFVTCFLLQLGRRFLGRGERSFVQGVMVAKLFLDLKDRGFLRGLGGRRGRRTTGRRIGGLVLADKKRRGERDQVGRTVRVGARWFVGVRREGTRCASVLSFFSGVSPDSFPLIPKTVGLLDPTNGRAGAR